MRKIPAVLLYRLVLLFSCCGFPGIARAQSSGPENVIVDGNLAEWGDSLHNYDKAADLYYQVHNDHDFLYIAFRRPRYALKIVMPKRILFEVSAAGGDKAGMQIIYPAHYSGNKDEMWNFLEIKNVGSSSFDTVTIYNEYGIQASGGFWYRKAVAVKKASTVNGTEFQAELGAAFAQTPVLDRPPASETGTVTVFGADGELAIPMKLLPAAMGTCNIRIVIAGETDIGNALTTAGHVAGFDLSNGTAGDIEDLLVESKLSITYRLK